MNLIKGSFTWFILLLSASLTIVMGFATYRRHEEWLVMKPYYNRADSLFVESQKINSDIDHIYVLLRASTIMNDSLNRIIIEKEMMYNQLIFSYELVVLQIDSLDRTNKYLE